ncbi:MAG: hypothetical protein Q8R28_04005 [Dehalococcoidia bacterium]|nr:hypothetical protein [Dehalococcoidia bacterium]
MAVISLRGMVIRKRPKSYMAKDAAYSVGGRSGHVLAFPPVFKKKTSQQQRIANAARACGIQRGISKRDLQTAMRDCIPGQFGDVKAVATARRR